MPRTTSLAFAPRRAAAVRAPIAIRAATRVAPMRKGGCSCGGLCPSCRPAALAGPDHPAEREADAVAARVMAMPEPAAAPVAREEETLRRQPEEELLQQEPDEEAELQLQPEEEEEPVQAKADPAAGRAAPAVAAAPMSGLGAGRPLPAPLRAFFEPRFARSFAHVRIHDGAAAHARAKGFRAQAFAYGRNIVFGSGRYAPESAEGCRLIAHELTHVVQQGRAGPAVQRWAITGDDATSNAPGDTLWGLASSVSGNGRDWTCIVPTRMQTSRMTPPPANFDAHYERYVRNGDTFNVSNLRLKTGPALRVHLFTNATDVALAGLFYPGMVASAGAVDADIAKAANEGRTPVDDIVIFGHAGGRTMFGGLGSFDPTALEDEPATFALAERNLLPRRCWLTRDATVRSVGCNSSDFATAFARQYLRRGASITSTTSSVSPCCHGVWTQLAFTSSPAPGSAIRDGPFANVVDFHAGRFWTTVAGRL